MLARNGHFLEKNKKKFGQNKCEKVFFTLFFS